MSQFDARAVEKAVQRMLGRGVAGTACHRDVAEHRTHYDRMTATPRSTQPGASALVRAIGANTSIPSAGGTQSCGVSIAVRWEMPALFTSTSIGPKNSRPSQLARRHPECERSTGSRATSSGRGQARRTRSSSATRRDDSTSLRAALRGEDRQRLADAAGGAGDPDGLACK